MLASFQLLLTALSWIYWLVCLYMVWIFFRRPQVLNPGFTPPVSILKPVKGVDNQAYDNFVSFCRQDYPVYEIWFGIADADDPVIPLIQKLKENYPDLPIHLLVTPTQGTNHKASLLHQLARKAHYPILAVSDSDMRVSPDYLKRVVNPLADQEIGLVTCLYRGISPQTLTARLEALHMGVTFLPSVLLGRKAIKMRFAMGATEVMRKRDLERLGGFGAFADYLADDYQLGVRITKLGLRVHLSDYIITCFLGATIFKNQWEREVRWAQCSRISRPKEYPGIILSFSTPLATLFLLFSGFSILGWTVLSISILLRWIIGGIAARLTGDVSSQKWLFLLPMRDMLSALTWCMGLINRKIVWRGEAFILVADGRLEPISETQKGLATRGHGDIISWSVRRIDHILIQQQGIYEFSQNDLCMLRLSANVCNHHLVLADGTELFNGDKIGELHFWNEHIPPMPKDGPDLGWAIAFQRRSMISLEELACYIVDNSQFETIKAFHGDPPFGSRYGQVNLKEMAKRWGFEIIDHSAPQGNWDKFAEFWVNFYAFGLLWAFNRASMKTKGFTGVKRFDLWMSRESLLRRYGPISVPKRPATDLQTTPIKVG